MCYANAETSASWQGYHGDEWETKWGDQRIARKGRRARTGESILSVVRTRESGDQVKKNTVLSVWTIADWFPSTCAPHRQDRLEDGALLWRVGTGPIGLAAGDRVVFQCRLVQ